MIRPKHRRSARTRRNRKLARLWPWLPGLGAAFGAFQSQQALANPEGMTVSQGSASVVTGGQNLTVKVAPVTVLDWRSFNIGALESTTFLQPSQASVVFNRVNDSHPSAILGTLTGNGVIILSNPNGLLFGPGSVISSSSFIATTALQLPDINESAWRFGAFPPAASIINYGTVKTASGGSVFLLAEKVENHGILSAPDGSLGLYAGKEVMMSQRPDGRGISAKVSLPQGSVGNTGQLLADAGLIALEAQVVNLGGLIQANSVGQTPGKIEIRASQSLAVASGAIIAADGGAGAASRGGEIILKSEGDYTDDPSARVSARGGPGGGDGGKIEVSALNFLTYSANLDALALPGWSYGDLLLDPDNIDVGNSGSGKVPANGTVGQNSSGTLALNVSSAFKNFSRITLQAKSNITLKQGTTWNLTDSTGVTDGERLLRLQAGNNIVFENNTRITDSGEWSINLEAGYNFITGDLTPNKGSILLNSGEGKSGTGAIALGSGALKLGAGKDILVGAGFIRTEQGGSIQARTVSGDIDAGKNAEGYEFVGGIYRVSVAGLGQIATARGGNISLDAGRDVISQPTTSSTKPPGATGAYGVESGDVTISAGRSILGNFTLRNGQGLLRSGVSLDAHGNPVAGPQGSVGSATSPVSLSLISGNWNVQAAKDVFIAEVRNPSGTFNRNKSVVDRSVFPGNLGAEEDATVPDRIAFNFDYAKDAGVDIWSGNSIHLLGANLPRVKGQNDTMKAVYPPKLSLETGAGGVELQNSLTLFPSPEGQLQIITHDGGDVNGRQVDSTLTTISMSDSGHPSFVYLPNKHSVRPIHEADNQPVKIEVDGGVSNFAVNSAKSANIKVKGDTYNFGYLGQNLREKDTTSIEIGGDVTFRGNLTTIKVLDALPSEVFNPAVSSNPDLARKLRWSPDTGTLSFLGQMTSREKAFLENPTVIALNELGRPAFDENGVQLTAPLAISQAQRDAFDRLYLESQSASLGDQGLAVSGPGSFNIKARSMDLGISGGILAAPGTEAQLKLSTKGANLKIDLSGNLTMTSSKIAGLGFNSGIDLKVGGRMNVGGQESFFGDPDQPKGIFTASGGNVSVEAKDTISVNGSRIAAYNGGDVKVTSLTGDIDAGGGGFGYVTVNSFLMDESGNLSVVNGTIPGSGILATTLPGSPSMVGNIAVNAPKGNVLASRGGITQLAYNGAGGVGRSITVKAGGNIEAGQSGIIGGKLDLEAGGNINGLVIGIGGDPLLLKGENVNVTAVSSGTVQIQASGTVSGTIIGGSGVNVSGSSVDAALVSNSVQASGDTSGAKVGVPQGNVARNDPGAGAESNAAKSKSLAGNTGAENDKDSKKNQTKPKLTRTVGRVTVILPPKK